MCSVNSSLSTENLAAPHPLRLITKPVKLKAHSWGPTSQSQCCSVKCCFSHWNKASSVQAGNALSDTDGQWPGQRAIALAAMGSALHFWTGGTPQGMPFVVSECGDKRVPPNSICQNALAALSHQSFLACTSTLVYVRLRKHPMCY